MSTMIHSKVVKIGNSRGVRIPRTLLEQAGLTDEVVMSVEGNKLIIQTAHQPRLGWELKFAAMSGHADDQLLEAVTTTHWDEDEWEW